MFRESTGARLSLGNVIPDKLIVKLLLPPFALLPSLFAHPQLLFPGFGPRNSDAHQME
jgi:hypothetical protein